jgi:protein-L-isoaspartate(D-aspartate) O-methyltransferase
MRNLWRQLRFEGIQDEHVLKAMEKLPRELFVGEHVREEAYENMPLPIGYGQTISQPYIVAFMTECLCVDNEDIVLEIGTGSGYQSAVLAQLVKRVYSVEIIKELGISAKERLKKLHYDNVEIIIGDGYYGWIEHAPYDKIIVTAAANEIPPPLVEQLKNQGRMVIPVGFPYTTQHLMLITKSGGIIASTTLLPVSFVPFTGKH